jgi:hypothetical protein
MRTAFNPDEAVLVDVSVSDDDLSEGAALIYVGTSGNLEVTTHGGTKIVVPNLQDGQICPVVVTKVWNANTTATNLMALYVK